LINGPYDFVLLDIQNGIYDRSIETNDFLKYYLLIKYNILHNSIFCNILIYSQLYNDLLQTVKFISQNGYGSENMQVVS
jgi:hypothetical protein